MRSFFLISAFLLAGAGALPAFAADHPHKNTPDNSESENSDFAQKLKERLADYDMIETEIETETREGKTTEKHVRVYKFKSGDEMREKSKQLEEMIVESGVLSNLADMIADFAEDVEVEKSDQSFAFRFDGDTIGEVKRDADDRVVLKSMDKEMTVEKESYIKDGKTRTRIVIDMEGDGSDVDLDDVLTQE